jgi:hypothetical protein
MEEKDEKEDPKEILFAENSKNKLIVKGSGDRRTWEAVAELGGAEVRVTIAQFELAVPDDGMAVFEALSSVHDTLLEAQTDLKILAATEGEPPASHMFLAEMKKEIVCAEWAKYAYAYLIGRHGAEVPGDSLGKLGMGKDAAYDLRIDDWPDVDRELCAIVRHFAQNYVRSKRAAQRRASVEHKVRV